MQKCSWLAGFFCNFQQLKWKVLRWYNEGFKEELITGFGKVGFVWGSQWTSKAIFPPSITAGLTNDNEAHNDSTHASRPMIYLKRSMFKRIDTVLQMVIHYVNTGWPNYVTNVPESINSCFSNTVKMFSPQPMVYDLCWLHKSWGMNW